MKRRRRSRRRRPCQPPKEIRLHTCTCANCKGRAAVCTAAFNWIDKSGENHAQSHAQEDLLNYFDALPIEIQDALNRADVNVCSWCAEIWANNYGVAAAIELIYNVRFIDESRAVTGLLETILAGRPKEKEIS